MISIQNTFGEFLVSEKRVRSLPERQFIERQAKKRGVTFKLRSPYVRDLAT